MSRIGKQPVVIPANVKVEVDGDNNGVFEFSNTYSWAQIAT